MGRTKEEILPEIEALLVEYIQAGTSVDSLVLDGYVIKARTLDVAHLNTPQHMGTTIWIHPNGQDVFKSLGLAKALNQDVERYYEYLYDQASEIGE